jgi:DNA (cytosine-5)-methyltransferase 1
MTSIVITAIGENRQKPRFWLEGKKLEREGFMPGDTFKLEDKGDHFLLVRCKDGDKSVSSRKGKGAIIDITAQYLSKWFEVGQKLRAAIRRGKILVKRYFRTDRIARRVKALREALTKGNISTASGFHGGGVMARALHEGLAKAGASSFVQVAVEIEGKYLDSSLRNNDHIFRDESIVIEGAIQDICLEKPVEVNIWESGIPCTGASLAGRSKNKISCAEEHSNAGALFFNCLQWIDQLNPAIVVLENVKQYQNTASMVVIRSVLSSLGYKVQERIFNGNEFGALESRDRLVVVGVSEGVGEFFNIDDVFPVQSKPKTLGDVLEPISDSDERWKSYDYLKQKEDRDIAAGKGFRRQLFDANSEYIATVTRQYNKVRSTDPFLKHPTDPELTRLLTPAEHARVKGIPESVVNENSVTTAHEILGQSVIYPVFVALGERLGGAIWQAYEASTMELDFLDHQVA